MAERKRYGGKGNRNPDRTKYTAMQRPICVKPPPKDFRETFLEIGYDAERYYQCRWPVFARWIEECGGQELLAARREWLRVNGRNRIAHVQHVKGWSAAKLEALHRGEATA